jgi:hypothetical protein
MNKKLIGPIITQEITDRLTQVVDDMSNDKFVELIMDKYYKETNEEIDEDEVRDLIGDKVLPLYQKISEYIVEEHLKF